MPDNDSSSLADDVLRGAEPIAVALNLTTHQTFRRLEAGLIPARKEGGQWVTTRTALRRHYENIDLPPPSPARQPKEKKPKKLKLRRRS